MDIQKKKKEIEKNFNNLKVQVEKLNLQIRQTNEELLKLQGEYRLLEIMEKEKLNLKGTKDDSNPPQSKNAI